jgi:CRISPR-associated exonuclease Cas4
MHVEIPDYIPLSFLNQMAYCPRRFWLMYVQGEMEINAPVLEGQLRHQHAHQPGTRKTEEGRTVRSVQVWSDRLRVAGVADFIEERHDVLIPLEHKRGKIGQWRNDQVQLCAQAMCLEERTGARLEYGEIFYWASRRRERIVFDDGLRQHTMETAQAAFDMLQRGVMPYPIDHAAKCRDCSLEPICLPRETLALLKEETR